MDVHGFVWHATSSVWMWLQKLVWNLLLKRTAGHQLIKCSYEDWNWCVFRLLWVWSGYVSGLNGLTVLEQPKNRIGQNKKDNNPGVSMCGLRCPSHVADCQAKIAKLCRVVPMSVMLLYKGLCSAVFSSLSALAEYSTMKHLVNNRPYPQMLCLCDTFAKSGWFVVTFL